jgi:hypothetical protein
MANGNSALLRLRAAFRYAYIALLILFVPFAIYCATFGLTGRHIFLNSGILGEFPVFVAALGLGLIVPLFLGAWLLVASHILGNRRQA